MIEIYETNSIYYDENPLILLTSGESGNSVFAEYIIFLRDQEKTGYWMRYVSEKQTIEAIGFEMNEEFIREDAKEQALNRLHIHQNDRILKQPIYGQFTREKYVISKQADLTPIRRFIFNGSYIDRLHRIKEQTKSIELKETLDCLLKINQCKIFSE